MMRAHKSGRRSAVAILLATAIGLGAAHASAAPMSDGIGLPRDASAHGHRIDWLINVTNILTAALFLVMAGWILYAGIRHNAKNQAHTAKYDHGSSRRSIMLALSMAGAVFLVVDGNLFVNSTMDLHYVFQNYEKIEKDPNAIRIEINAHQWAWDFRYAGPDGKFNTKDDIISLNDMRVPVGVPILLQVASTDVLHSFNLPNFRTKVDAVPGTINRLWFEAKQTGEFNIGCAQHCGTNHYKMKGYIRVLSQEDYAKWADEASKNSSRFYDEANENAHWGWEWKGI